MSKVDFAKLAFKGARFQGGVMPVDVLPELAAYRTLILSVAKTLFLEQNPNRVRLPKGFEFGFQLVLEEVTEGSAIPHLARVVPAGALHFGGDVFDRARDYVEEGIAAASVGGHLPKILSREVLPRFAAFGRTLQHDEQILIAKPTEDVNEGARYDRAVRHELLRLSMTSYEDDVDLIGVVRAADKDASSFALTTRDGDRIDVRPSVTYFPMAKRSFLEESEIRVRGTGLFDANGALQRVLSTSDVSPSEEDDAEPQRGCLTPVDKQIESLANLPPDWYDETSQAYQRDELDWLQKLLMAVINGFSVPIPYVYPTPEGFARAEWSAPGLEVVVNINIAERTAEALAVRIDSPTDFAESTFTFSETGAESSFGRFLSDHLNAVTHA